LIEAGSKEEVKRIRDSITEKCGKELVAKVEELRNPRLVIYNIPENITIDNENSELQLEESDITTKFIYRMKRNTKNLVIEVNSHTRKQILNTRMKIGWEICKVDYYIHIYRCFTCSRYNHRLADYRGEETCPLCSGRNKLRECSSSQNDYKCINCMTFNKHNHSKPICTNHSSLDKNFPSLQALIMKFKQNTDY
jgi:DNA-directed RNA polymerase subunit RPC12/RpoP